MKATEWSPAAVESVLACVEVIADEVEAIRKLLEHEFGARVVFPETGDRPYVVNAREEE